MVGDCNPIVDRQVSHWLSRRIRNQKKTYRERLFADGYVEYTGKLTFTVVYGTRYSQARTALFALALSSVAGVAKTNDEIMNRAALLYASAQDKLRTEKNKKKQRSSAPPDVVQSSGESTWWRLVRSLQWRHCRGKSPTKEKGYLGWGKPKPPIPLLAGTSSRQNTGQQQKLIVQQQMQISQVKL